MPTPEEWKKWKVLAEKMARMDEMDKESAEYKELLALRQTVLPPSGLPSAEHEELRRSAVIGLPAALSGQMDPNRDEYKALMAMRNLVVKENKASDCIDALTSHMEACRLMREKRWADAMPLLDKALAMEQQQPAIYKSRAVIHLQLGNHLSALADANEALKLNPRDNWAKQYASTARKALEKGNKSGGKNGVKKEKNGYGSSSGDFSNAKDPSAPGPSSSK